MWKLTASVAAVALVALGGEGLYHAFKGRHRVPIDCQALENSRPASHRLLLTGCEVVYAGVGYRGGPSIEELFFPVRPAGRAAAAPIVVVTRNPAALVLAQPILGSGRNVSSEQSLATVRKIAEVVGADHSIDGLVRAGVIERLRSRRILSGLTATPVAPDAILLDLEGKPDFLRPALALASGLLLAVLPFAFARRARRALAGDVATEEFAAPPAEVRGDVVTPKPTAAGSAAVALPRLLLLNLSPVSGPEAVETAPALGKRGEVIERLRDAVPDLVLNGDGRTLARRDRSLHVDIGVHDPVATAVIDARGEAGAALVKEILLVTGWRAFAPKSGLFVNGDELAVMAALTRDDG